MATLSEITPKQLHDARLEYEAFCKYDKQYNEACEAMKAFPEYGDDSLEPSAEFVRLTVERERAHRARMNNIPWNFFKEHGEELFDLAMQVNYEAWKQENVKC